MMRMARLMGIMAVFLLLLLVMIPRFVLSPKPPIPTNELTHVRQINKAEFSYWAMFPKTGFSPSLQALGGAPCSQPADDHACFLDAALASGTIDGYTYTYTVKSGSNGMNIGYTVHADPMPEPTPGWFDRTFLPQQKHKQRYLYTDQTGVIRSQTEQEADENSPPLQ